MTAIKTNGDSLSNDCVVMSCDYLNGTDNVTVVKTSDNESVKDKRETSPNVDKPMPHITKDPDALISNIKGETSIAKQESKMENTEGGWKFVVLIAAFISTALLLAYPFYMSVLYVEWLEEFETSNVETSLVQSVCNGVFAIGGLISGIIVTKFGPRTSCITSGLLSASGIALSYFAPNIIYLVFSLGVVSGIAFSMAYVSTVTSVGLYFKGKQKALAMAFIACGSGVSGTVFPVVMEELIFEYGWRGSMLILAGIMLNLVVIGCVYRSPTSDNTIHQRKGGKEQYCLSTHKYGDACNPDKMSDGRNGLDNALPEQNSNTNENLSEIIQHVFKNKTFICFCVTYAICVSSMLTFYTFFIDYFKSKGLASIDAIKIIFYVNIVSIVSRLGFGFLTQLHHVSVFSIPVVGSLLGCLSMILLTITGSSFISNLCITFLFGIGIGGMRISITVCVAKLVEQKNYPTAMGLSMTMMGVSSVIIGLLSGFIRDTTGDYQAYTILLAAALFMTSILYFIIMVYRHCSHKKKTPATFSNR